MPPKTQSVEVKEEKPSVHSCRTSLTAETSPELPHVQCTMGAVRSRGPGWMHPQSWPQTAALRALYSTLSYAGTAQTAAGVFVLVTVPDLFTTIIPAALICWGPKMEEETAVSQGHSKAMPCRYVC